jgi:hypothetical protein
VALATHDIANRLRRKLREKWFMSGDCFSLLATLEGVKGCSKPQVATALAGTRSLSNETTTALEPLIRELDELVDSLVPVRPWLTNAIEVRSLLQAKRSGRLRIHVEFTPEQS